MEILQLVAVYLSPFCFGVLSRKANEYTINETLKFVTSSLVVTAQQIFS